MAWRKNRFDPFSQGLIVSLTRHVMMMAMSHLLKILAEVMKVLKFPVSHFFSDPEVSRKRTETVHVTNTSQAISSPYFNSSLMPGSFKMEWLLRAPEGELIVLEVTNILLYLCYLICSSS